MNDAPEDKIYFEPDGRMYKKEPFIKRTPRYTFIKGKFIGKFYSDIENTDFQIGEFYNFKIYEGTVEIFEKSKSQADIQSDVPEVTNIPPSQLPDKIHFFERLGDKKVYYDLKIENPLFRNLEFVSRLQQTEGDEAFGTLEADFYGYLIDFIEEHRYKKRYKLLHLKECKNCIQTSEKTGKVETEDNHFREEFFCKGKKSTFWGEWQTIVIEPETETEDGPVSGPPPIQNINDIIKLSVGYPCIRNLLIALFATIISAAFGWTPLFIISLIWLVYVLYSCFLGWLRYIFYLLGILFLIGLIYSVLNINWNKAVSPYIPHSTTTKQRIKPELVKIIKLVEPGKPTDKIVISKQVEWSGYNGEKYSGQYTVLKSDLDNSRNFKNGLTENLGYEGVLMNIRNNDREKLKGLYEMFDHIKDERKLNDKAFAEMVVSFAQHFPYYVVLDGTCNPTDYKDNSIKELLKQNPGMCSPNQKFGITTPVEFITNGIGDCDSRTLLLHTVLKHYNYDAVILSSDIYKHSILGVNLPYNGQTFNTGSSKYIMWETTDIGFKPGEIPAEVRNISYWYLSLK